MSPWRAIPLALLLAVIVRVPFWIEALHTPVDGDTAIVGLMARHPGEGTTLWGQPYGSPLDAWVESRTPSRVCGSMVSTSARHPR